MILGSFALKFAFFAHFMRFRLKTRYDLRAFSWGKFIWKELICVNNLTFCKSVEVGGAPGRGEDGEPTWISRLAFSSPPCVVVVSVA